MEKELYKLIQLATASYAAISPPPIHKTSGKPNIIDSGFVPAYVNKTLPTLQVLQTAEWGSTKLSFYSAKGYRKIKSYIKDLQIAQQVLVGLGIKLRPVHIYVLYIPGQQKRMQCPSCVLGSTQVNSAFYFDGQIWIYRSEELVKTTIHEMVHAYHVDTPRYPRIERQWLDTHNIPLKFGNLHPNDNPCLTEGLVDFMACLTMACLRAKDVQSLKHNLELQRSHVQAQAEKVKCVLAKTGFHENTHTFAYYVIKGVLFNNLKRSFTYFKTRGWYVNTESLLHNFLIFLGSIRFPETQCLVTGNSLRMNVFE